jgi:hypothetical protein
LYAHMVGAFTFSGFYTYLFWVYDGGMVDDRALRFRQEYRAPVPPRPLPRNAVADVNRLMRGADARSGLSRADQDLSNRRGGELFLSPMSTLLDEAKNSGVVQRGTPLSAGLTGAAFVTDFLNPSFGPPIVGGAAQGVQTAGRVANLAPAPRQAYLNSLMGRLYHGSKSREPFVVQRNAGNPDNLFGADFFTTTSRQLAESPGYGAGSAHRVRLPLSEAENLRVLDLMPGAPTVRDQFPGLADFFSGLGTRDLNITGSLANTVDPAAIKAASDAINRHVPFTRNFSPAQWGKVLSDQGINAIRHESGRLVPGAEVVAPVFAFLNAPPLKATPSRSVNRMLQDVGFNVRAGASNANAYLRSLLHRLRNPEAPYDPRFDDL